MIDSGQVPGPAAISVQHDLGRSYVGGILELATLAPQLVEAVLAGAEPSLLSLAKLRRALPLRWDRQRGLMGFPAL